MHRQTLQTDFLNTMSWLDNRIIDWAYSGKQYFLDGHIEELGSYSFSFPFDSSVTSDNGVYAFIYQKLGTKGILLKNGKFLREINRSYYQANVYEYPVTFFTSGENETFLVHCPTEYCQIDFENIETGELVTKIADRKPSDFFHSRFEVSPDNKTLLSKGWIWHPADFVEIFDIEECLNNPLLLDKSKFKPDVDAEICVAGFIDNENVLIGSPNENEPFNDEPTDKLINGQIAIWNIKTNEISKPIMPKFKIGGHLFPIDKTYAWDLFEYPKIVDFKTGEIIDKIEDINSGQQISSIIHHINDLPKIAFNKKTRQIAIAKNSTIEILTK
jgi:WD40 repeat protein